MAEQEKEYILTKRRLDITDSERQSVMRPLGIGGLPFPTVVAAKSQNGTWKYELQIVQDTRKPVLAFSDRTIRDVTATMHRDMPTPNMMYAEQTILEHTDPQRADRVVLVLGDPGWGKTHAAKKIGGLLHPEGAIVVDMGGMNAQELVWKTVIDYGTGVRELLDKRLKEGKVSAESLEYLNEEFPGSVMPSKDGAPARINWSAVGQRRQKKDEATGKMETVEDRGAAVERAKMVLDKVYEDEKIAVQENAFGIKTVPGELIEAWKTGRPLFTDEMTKAIPSTINSLQSILEVANNNARSYRAKNPIPDSSGGTDNDSPPFFDFRQEDMKGSFIWLIAGNYASDGVTTFDLSKSTGSRAEIVHVAEPQPVDWAHRLSQILTGLPLTTYNIMYGKALEADPEAYANFLVKMRTLNMSPDEIAAVPDYQIKALQAYAKSTKAINQAGEFFYTDDQLSKQAADLMKQDAYKDLVEELTEFGTRLNITPRMMIQLVSKSLHHRPKARPVEEAKLNFDLEAVFNNLDTSIIGDTAPAWQTLGENLSVAIIESIMNTTAGMPLTRKARMQLAEEHGITPADFKEAEQGENAKTLANLLSFQDHEDAGGSQELREMRATMLAAIRGKHRNLRQSDDVVLPLSSLARAVKEYRDGKHTEFDFVVPNDDLDTIKKTPIVAARALPIYELDMEDPEAAEQYEFVDINSVLEGMVLPQFFEENRQRIWPREVTELLEPKAQPQPKKDAAGNVETDADGKPVFEPKVIEPYKVVEGKGQWGFNMGILAGADASGNPSYLWVIEDKTKLTNDGVDPQKRNWERYLVIGNEPIAAELEVALAERGVTYLVKGDANTKTAINDFLIEGAKVRGDDGSIDPDTAKAATESIVKSYAILHTLRRSKQGEGGRTLIPADATLGEMIQTSPDDERPAVFTNIVKPKVKAAGPGV